MKKFSLPQRTFEANAVEVDPPEIIKKSIVQEIAIRLSKRSPDEVKFLRSHVSGEKIKRTSNLGKFVGIAHNAE